VSDGTSSKQERNSCGSERRGSPPSPSPHKPQEEPCVWTERMLAALKNGVKGGKWFSLIDKVSRQTTLLSSFNKVKANKGAPGIDRITVEIFERHLSPNIERLENSLKDGTYTPQEIRRVYIPKPGSSEKRPLGIPTVRDRVVQGAIREVIEPIFENEFSENSFGFRPKRGCKDALRRVDRLLKEGYIYVIDADIKGYFDSIPHDKLMEKVEEKIADGKLLTLINKYLKQGILDGTKIWTPEEGTPQGAVLSPLLANIYLNPLDHKISKHGKEMTRYADDFVVQCKTEEEAKETLSIIKQWTEESGLQLHPEKTKIVNALEPGGFDFLGYHFERNQRYPRQKSYKKIRETIKQKTKRTNGNSMDTIIKDLNKTLKGWFEYFKHSTRITFQNIDGYVRGRLRTILRKRRGGKGRARGDDHHRWKNAYFMELGLFSMTAARDSICQPAKQ
jgi:RNA-directed DNA polymerase